MASQYDNLPKTPNLRLNRPTQRSNSLHIKYNELKQRVNAAETVDDVNNIMWPED